MAPRDGDDAAAPLVDSELGSDLETASATGRASVRVQNRIERQVPALTVAAVARRLGVAPATLRTWDRRYGLGPSAHAAGSHRRYTADDVARLLVMRGLTLDGVAPSEAANGAAASSPSRGAMARLCTTCGAIANGHPPHGRFDPSEAVVTGGLNNF
jgi:transposase-like protein